MTNEEKMTPEEAIAYGKECLSWNKFSKDMKMYQFIEMAIKALSQEPTDAISRDAVCKMIYAEFVNPQDGMQEWRNAVNDVVENILHKAEQLPSVAQKSGKWIVHEKPHGIRYLECPYCNIWYLNEHLIRNSYCPNCGSYNGGDNNGNE